MCPEERGWGREAGSLRKLNSEGLSELKSLDSSLSHAIWLGLALDFCGLMLLLFVCLVFVFLLSV